MHLRRLQFLALLIFLISTATVLAAEASYTTSKTLTPTDVIKIGDTPLAEILPMNAHWESVPAKFFGDGTDCLNGHLGRVEYLASPNYVFFLSNDSQSHCIFSAAVLSGDPKPGRACLVTPEAYKLIFTPDVVANVGKHMTGPSSAKDPVIQNFTRMILTCLNYNTLTLDELTALLKS